MVIKRSISTEPLDETAAIMCEGKAGAMNCVMRILEKDPADALRLFLDLDDMNIRGQDLYIALNVVAERNVDKLMEMAANRSNELINGIVSFGMRDSTEVIVESGASKDRGSGGPGRSF